MIENSAFSTISANRVRSCLFWHFSNDIETVVLGLALIWFTPLTSHPHSMITSFFYDCEHRLSW